MGYTSFLNTIQSGKSYSLICDSLTLTEDTLENTRDVLLIVSLEPLRPYVSTLFPPSYLPMDIIYAATDSFYARYFASGSDYVHFQNRTVHLRESVEILIETLLQQMDKRDVNRFCTWIAKLDMPQELTFSISLLGQILFQNIQASLSEKLHLQTILKIQKLLEVSQFAANKMILEMDEIEENYKREAPPQKNDDGNTIHEDDMPLYQMGIVNLNLKANSIRICILFKQLRDLLSPDEFAILSEAILKHKLWQKYTIFQEGYIKLVPLESIIDSFYELFS